MTPKKRTPKRYRGPAWSELELTIMRKLFPAISSDMMARVLRRSRKAISARAHAMGLSKSPEHMQREYALRVERSKAHPNTIKPGARPWNTGLRGVTGVHPNNRANQFRPGQLSGQAAVQRANAILEDAGIWAGYGWTSAAAHEVAQAGIDAVLAYAKAPKPQEQSAKRAPSCASSLTAIEAGSLRSQSARGVRHDAKLSGAEGVRS